LGACQGGQSYLSPRSGSPGFLKPSRPPPKGWTWVNSNGKVRAYASVGYPILSYKGAVSLSRLYSFRLGGNTTCPSVLPTNAICDHNEGPAGMKAQRNGARRSRPEMVAVAMGSPETTPHIHHGRGRMKYL
jgi:hypothetical protein